MSVTARNLLAAFESLSLEEKQTVAREISRRLRHSGPGKAGKEQLAMEGDQPTRVRACDLTAMAADPEIQRELRLINVEFAVAETDGLEEG